MLDCGVSADDCPLRLLNVGFVSAYSWLLLCRLETVSVPVYGPFQPSGELVTSNEMDMRNHRVEIVVQEGVALKRIVLDFDNVLFKFPNAQNSHIELKLQSFISRMIKNYE